ncbi:MAG: galactose-1-phosphate uridylyltransferase [Thermoanaerobaculia bacterium]
MSTIRRHPLTGELVILAPERSERPNAFDLRNPATEAPCPFCPGHENETPPELLRVAHGDSWLLRVVPNRYPAVRLDASGPNAAQGLHEVVIESPDHGAAFEQFSAEHARVVLESYLRRFIALRQQASIEYILFFKNDGRPAGESIEHPHSQIMALTFVPPDSRVPPDVGSCALCALIAAIPRDLVISESDAFLTIAPPASRFPYEQWIVPKAHAPDFSGMDAETTGEMARRMQSALRNLRRIESEAPYNWIIHNAPPREAHPFRHWYLEILPRMTQLAGFELGTGMTINIVSPERAAEELRERSDL